MIGPSDAQVEYRLTGEHGCGKTVTVNAAPLIAAVTEKAEETGVTVTALLGSARDAKRSFFRARALLYGARDSVELTAVEAVELATAAAIDVGELYPDAALPKSNSGTDDQTAYHLDANERPLVWVGEGVAEFGIKPGSAFAREDFAKARRLMHGENPRTGEELVAPKLAIAPAAKLPAAPFVRAARRTAAERGVPPVELFTSKRQKDLFGRMERQLHRFGESHRAPVSHLMKLAEAADVDAVGLYGEAEVEQTLRAEAGGRLDVRPLLTAVEEKAAREGHEPEELFTSRSQQRRFAQCRNEAENRLRQLPIDVREAVAMAKAAGVSPGALWDREEVKAALLEGRVEVGNRGTDVTLDLPKSNSVFLAYVDEPAAAEVEDVYTSCAREAIATLERWTAYAMRGRHGEGESAETIRTSGFSGWMMVHRAARPVGDAPYGDPHFHLHFALANLVKGADGQWSTVAAGGRDLHRHAKATQAVMSARVRHELHHRYGIDFRRDERSGAWEISGIPESSIRLFSKRDSQVRELFNQLGIDYGTATLKERTVVSTASKAAKNADTAGAADDVLRGYWQAEGRTAGDDPQSLVEHVRDGHRRSNPSLEELCRIVFDPEQGLTAHAKEFTHVAAISAVLDALPYGIPDAAEAEHLTGEVLHHAGYAVPLEPKGPQHYAHPDRYTTADVLAAEERILTEVAGRRGTGTACVTPDAVDMTLATTEAQRGPGFTFSDEQRAVLHRLLAEGHGVDAVVGVAGAGKTTIMDTARAAWQAQGYVVAGASTAAVACANLKAEAGIPARTMASWLTSIRAGEQALSGIDVLVVDEAAMCDDRAIAELLTHAATTGTKVVGIGDPKQLHSPGIGGSFAALHQLVDGLALTENHRQRDAMERRALAMWRDDMRTDALRALAGHGRVHAMEDKDATIAAMITMWADKRARYADDAHTAVEQLLMLAATNETVEELNLGARALRKQNGELTGEDQTFQLSGDGELTLAVGDQVLVRVNDYRSERSHGAHDDVLNGHRGLVRSVDASLGVEVEWRQQSTDGEGEVAEWVGPDYIAGGGLSLGYAITGHKSQGLSVEEALVYGPGAQANSLYTMLSRDKRESHLFLPLSVYETNTDKAPHGPPATEQERLDRAVAGLLSEIDTSTDERLVLTDLPALDLPTGIGDLISQLGDGRTPKHPVGTDEQTEGQSRDETEPPWGDAPYGHLATPALHAKARRAGATARAARSATTRHHDDSAKPSAAVAAAGQREKALRAEIERRSALPANQQATEDAARQAGQGRGAESRHAPAAPMPADAPPPQRPPQLPAEVLCGRVRCDPYSARGLRALGFC